MMKKPTHPLAPAAVPARSRKAARRTPADRASQATEASEGPRTMTRKCRAQLADLLA
jgi:hypothetical protein